MATVCVPWLAHSRCNSAGAGLALGEQIGGLQIARVPEHPAHGVTAARLMLRGFLAGMGLAL
jgi:hypothetical protein